MIKPRLKTSKKKCEFEGCKKEFKGVTRNYNQGKYCEEHRKQKYRKFIDKDKIKKKREIKSETNNNQLIKHSYKHPVVVIGTCQLEGCNKNFDLLLIPNTHIYPKFCEDHRNEFKRERFLNGK